MAGRRILGVFAHPDDEVFCVGGSLAKYASDGAQAMVVSATRGEAGQIRDAAVATRATLGAVREAELHEACRRLGVQHVRCLDFVDGTLQGVDRALLVDELTDVLEELEPDVVVTFGNDGFYGHPDHVTISDAVTASCTDRPGVRLYHSHFPRTRLLMLERLAAWLVEMPDRFKGSASFARAFSLYAQETTAVGYADDHIAVAWFPPGVAIVEQGEEAHALYLILSGEVEVTEDQSDGSRVVLRRCGPGEFFGEIAITQGATRTANVVAIESVTCLVFSYRAPTLWAGRGNVSLLSSVSDERATAATAAELPGATTVIDVRDVIDVKIQALAAHRSQYPIDPEVFPRWLLSEMMGYEHFVRIQPPLEPERDLFA